MEKLFTEYNYCTVDKSTQQKMLIQSKKKGNLNLVNKLQEHESWFVSCVSP